MYARDRSRLPEGERLLVRRSLELHAMKARQAFAHLDSALVILRTLDDSVYWDMAAGACDAADNLRAGFERQADDHDLGGEIPFDDTCLALHRRTVGLGPPNARIRASSATASAFDMVAFAHGLVPPHGHGTGR
jgi:hypothetical protein